MIRIFLVFFLTFYARVCAKLPEQEEARARKLHEYAFERVPPNGFDHSRLRELLQEDRELLVRWMRDLLESRRASGNSEKDIRSSGTAVDLAILGDEWGLTVVADRIRNTELHSDHLLWKVRDARMIPKLGNYLFPEVPYTEIGDFEWTAYSGVIETLRYAPQLTPEVSNWAGELREKWGQSDVVNILREWYRENETKLREGKFLEIQPGRKPTVKSKVPKPEAPIVTERSGVVKEPEQGKQPAEPKAIVAATSDPPSWVLWTVGVSVIALALGIGVRWWRRV